MSDKTEYDLICSLGGNCAAAHNIAYRNMRFCALPFDWVYIKDMSPIGRLAEMFRNNFAKFCLKENLIELPINPAHPENVQYQDAYSGYVFANHFHQTIADGGYEPVKQKIDRRVSRLQDLIRRSKRVLFVLSINFEGDVTNILKLQSTLRKLYPNTVFDFVCVMFSCKSDSVTEHENITVYKYVRAENAYDYSHTNYEWRFLDNVSLSLNNLDNKPSSSPAPKIGWIVRNLFHMGYRNGTVLFCLLPAMHTALNIRLYLFGIKINFGLGKLRS